MLRRGWSAEEVARAVRLRRLSVWHVGHEQWMRLLLRCTAEPGEYTQVEYMGEPAVVAADLDILFRQGQ